MNGVCSRLRGCLGSYFTSRLCLTHSPDAQKPVQDASHTVQRTTGHFGFELLPTNRRVKSRHRRASDSRGPRAEADRPCDEPKRPSDSAALHRRAMAGCSHDGRRLERRATTPNRSVQARGPRAHGVLSVVHGDDAPDHILMLRCKVCRWRRHLPGVSLDLHVPQRSCDQPEAVCDDVWVDFRVKQVDIRTRRRRCSQVALFVCAETRCLTRSRTRVSSMIEAVWPKFASMASTTSRHRRFLRVVCQERSRACGRFAPRCLSMRSQVEENGRVRTVEEGRDSTKEEATSRRGSRGSGKGGRTGSGTSPHSSSPRQPAACRRGTPHAGGLHFEPPSSEAVASMALSMYAIARGASRGGLMAGRDAEATGTNRVFYHVLRGGLGGTYVVKTPRAALSMWLILLAMRHEQHAQVRRRRISSPARRGRLSTLGFPVATEALPSRSLSSAQLGAFPRGGGTFFFFLKHPPFAGHGRRWQRMRSRFSIVVVARFGVIAASATAEQAHGPRAATHNARGEHLSCPRSSKATAACSRSATRHFFGRGWRRWLPPRGTTAQRDPTRRRRVSRP